MNDRDASYAEIDASVLRVAAARDAVVKAARRMVLDGFSDQAWRRLAAKVLALDALSVGGGSEV
jgi:hypothetical protein